MNGMWTSGLRGMASVLAALLVGVMALPSIAEAADVYLNGVKVTGMVNQEFKGSTVRLDDKGNVWIQVEGIQVQRQDSGGGVQGGAVQQRPQLSKRYWLISENPMPGMAQYDIDVHINGQFVARVKSTETKQVVMDVTKFVQVGQNTINFTAVKNLAESRKSFSPDHYFKLLFGMGDKEGSSLMIERQVATYTRTAAQVDNDSRQETFQGE